MGDAMRDALVRFLDALDTIDAEHSEVMDSAVRIRMEEIIEDRFVTRAHRLEPSHEFAMFSNEGNVRVESALAAYLDEIGPLADALGLDLKERLKAVWDFDARSHNGTEVVDYLSYGCPSWPDVSIL
jgi:hypothetical protein